MAEPAAGPEALALAVERARAAGVSGDLAPVIVAVRAALQAGDHRMVAATLAALRPADRVDVFEAFELDEQRRLLEEMGGDAAADILEELADEDAAEVAGVLMPEHLAPILDLMEADEAADVLGDLTPEQAETALLAMDDAAEAEVRPLLAYPDETAGGRMTPAAFALRADESASQSIERLRRLEPDTQTAYYLYTVDRTGRLAGIVSLRQLITAAPESRVSVLMDEDVIRVAADDDQEAAARLMSRYDLLALPVVDAAGRLVGVITHDDLVDVLEEEATEDMYLLVGLDEEERALDPVLVSIRRRLPWLVANLATQLVLVFVLKSFQGLLDQVAVLAVLFPLVTGNGGNVGAQTTTMVVRSIALGEMERTNRRRFLAKEVGVGLSIGMVIGLLAGAIALVITGELALALRIALAMLLAMTLNLGAGAMAGVVVPLTLQRLGLDPAVASAVLVTTVTDTLGAVFFLGLYVILLR